MIKIKKAGNEDKNFKYDSKPQLLAKFFLNNVPFSKILM